MRNTIIFLTAFIFFALAQYGIAHADTVCSMLEPPPQFDHAPRERIDIKFEPLENVRYECADHIEGAYKLAGCEWGYGSVIHALLMQGTPEFEVCQIRHMNGHIVEFEETGSANPDHVGWH